MLKTMKEISAALMLTMVMITIMILPIDVYAAEERPITGVSFPEQVEIAVGETKTLEVKVKPSNTTYKTNVSWGCQNNGHFTYKVNGCGTYWDAPQSETITGVSEGKGYLHNTVKVYDSNKTYVTEYTVRTVVTVKGKAQPVPAVEKPTTPDNNGNKPIITDNSSEQSTTPTSNTDNTQNVPLKKISMDTSVLKLVKNQSSSLAVKYEPENTTDDKTVTWTSNNPDIVTVDTTGKVKAIKAGTATIKAKVGRCTATRKVTVLNYEKVPFSYSVSGQKLTVTCKGHCYSDARSYVVRLHSGSNITKQLNYRSTDKTATFEDLNPGQKYTVTVMDSKHSYGNDGLEETANIITVTAGKSKYDLYKNKTAVIKKLKEADSSHKKKLIFYYPSKKSLSYFTGSIWYFNQANEYACVADIDQEVVEKNLYEENITVNGKRCYKYEIDISYNYSKANEAKFKKALLKVKKKLSGSSANKVKRLDNYLRKNCKYDYSYNNYTAYDCLVKGKAVCQGYAEAASAVLNLAGVKTEYVCGQGNGTGGWGGHAWNIVKCNKKWYSCDFCWDSCINKTTYLLKGTKNKKFWSEHKLDKEYKTKAWKSAHPMSKKDYKL